MSNLNIDDLMLAGWGVANQLPEDNYVRKGWDVAFRIAKAADKEHPDIAIKQLSDAGKLLIKEMWKTQSITSENMKYVNKLNQTLAEFNSINSNDMTQKLSSAFWQSFEKRMGIQ